MSFGTCEHLPTAAWIATAVLNRFLLLRRCVELIINEQMSKYKARLKDISSLEFAESKAKSRLTHIRRSMVRLDRKICQSGDANSHHHYIMYYQ